MKNEAVEVFLVQTGGPIWANKDAGAWSIPKGEFTEDEDSLSPRGANFSKRPARR